MTKAAGYQEHVGEYGEHWNFFFTLAAVAALTAAVRLPPAVLLPAGAVVLTTHQACVCPRPGARCCVWPPLVGRAAGTSPAG